ncbi:MAG: hypothetical protein JWO31_1019 [Phycisphaerales bacterium]|nr:hypothetical protein [Phycisphaerales bacterium]
MPQLIDYPEVCREADGRGYVSLYPNSGAFGHPAGVATASVGWVGGDDPTLRPAARPLAVLVPPPAEATLAGLAVRAWRDLLPGGPVWVLPKAHWAYELDFGSAAWMPDLLRRVGFDPDVLATRHDGTAAAFAEEEHEAFAVLVEGLLTHLLGSDFQLIFPGRDAVCTIHHHKQLWWTSAEPNLVVALRETATRKAVATAG